LLVGTAQAEYLETGRASMETIVRELGQIQPANLGSANGAYNVATFDSYAVPNTPPIWRQLADTNELSASVFQQIFFLSRYNQQWKGTAYFVDTSAPPTGPGGSYVDTRRMGVGTLYRYETNAAPQYPSNSLVTIATNYFNNKLAWVTDKNYLRAPSNGVTVTRIADGIVHFRVSAYDTNGVLITRPHTNFNYIDFNGKPVANILVASNNFVAPNSARQTDYYYSFASNAVPAFLEVELGVLEDRTLARFYSLTSNPTAASAYLAKHSGQIHLFRQRVAIRNVDPAAYQ